jgi:ABC-2 type transport system ATP-binding protein
VLAIEIRGLTKRFGARLALDGVDLEVGAGEIVGLLGPNGAGKSTLVRALVGRVRADAGTIRLFGRDASERGAREVLGWVPQEIALYPDLSARENLELFARLHGLVDAAVLRAAAQGLDFANLAERADDVVETFSGGMKRRLNLVLGLLAAPKALLLDEPTVGVDPQSRERIFGMIEELSAQGIAVLYTTHYLEEAERLCDRVAIVDHGRIVAAGSSAELVATTVGDRRRITITAEGAIPATLAAEIEGDFAAADVHVDGSSLRLSSDRPAKAIPALLTTFESHGVAVRDLELQSPGLDDVFLKLTGKELRE